MPRRPKAVILNNSIGGAGRDNIAYVYGEGRRERIGELTELYPEIVSKDTFDQHADRLADVEVVFSTWGMPVLSPGQIERMKDLKVVFYGAGSVKAFAEDYLKAGVKVVSAWRANGAVVAEYTVGQILLACKGFYRNALACRTYEGRRSSPPTAPGILDAPVAVIGVGAIGRRVCELLSPYPVKLCAVDPYLPDEAAAALNATKISLEQAFAECSVVSNHLPNIPELRHAIRAEHFDSMRQGAAFINTGRGAQVDEAGMVEVLSRRPDITALLDVTHPEPPAADSPLYELANVWLTSHIAGTQNRDTLRMADLVISEFEAWRDGRALTHEVTLEMLPTMA